MICNVHTLDEKIKKSIIDNFNKNIYYNCKNLHDDKYTNREKKKN